MLVYTLLCTIEDPSCESGDDRQSRGRILEVWRKVQLESASDSIQLLQCTPPWIRVSLIKSDVNVKRGDDLSYKTSAVALKFDRCR